MAKVPTRQLGKNGPQVSVLGFGAMSISIGYATPSSSDEERFKVYDRAIDLGCTYFDSADVYGDSEDVLGRYFKKYPHQREKVSKNIISSVL
jgi:aryl-alcohol dehydrogenase-like predicted oxidoreductase